MKHCRTIKVALVAPNLSTRAIWHFLAGYLDGQYSQRHRPCGVVLDIIKCYNVLSGDVVYDIMVALGFPERVLSPWFKALGAMSRSVLLDGCVFGDAPASTGVPVPEGDPLAVIAMFAVSTLFHRYITWKVPESLVCCYTDNWESVCPHPDSLAVLLGYLRPFLEALKLPINPLKCWTRYLDAAHCKILRNLMWDGQHSFPVKLRARELSADISYCLKKAAQVRNSRVSKVHQRLLSLAGLPIPCHAKQRLLLSSVFPQALHASETSLVPKSVYERLRSKTAVGL